VQERLTEAIDNLRSAYARASRKSALKAAQDRKLHRRVGRGLAAARDAAVTVKTGRRPKRRSRRRAVVIGVVAVAGAALAAGPLRNKLTQQSGEEDLAATGPASEQQPQPSTV
jgi:hypothetical protein